MARTRFAEGVADIHLSDYQRVVRLVLARPLIAEGEGQGEDLRRVRRWAPQLRQDLEILGYTLHLGARSARLLGPSEGLSEAGGLRTSSGRPFDRQRYALLCLSLAGLEGGHTQITLSDLALKVRQRAEAMPRLPFDPDQHGDRRAFADAVAALEGWGVLSLTDGSAAAWARGREEGEGDALFDVDREIARLLFRPGRPLHHLGSVRRLSRGHGLALSRDGARSATRARLLRALLYQPVLYFEDLLEEERAYLQREAGPMGEELRRLTGCVLERRGEGLALIDPGFAFSDLRFPIYSSAGQCALLLIDSVAQRMEASPPIPLIDWPSAPARERDLADALDACLPDALVADDEALPPRDPPPGPIRAPFLEDAWLLNIAQEIQAAHGATLAQALRGEPQHLLDGALPLLAQHGLILMIPGGILLRPALGRFRAPQVTRAPETLSLFPDLAPAPKEPQ